MKKSECWYGIYPVKFIWRGPWNDPLLRYKGHYFNYYDIESLFFEVWRTTPDYMTANLTTQESADACFIEWMQKNKKRVKAHFDYRIELGKYDGIA